MDTTLELQDDNDSVHSGDGSTSGENIFIGTTYGPLYEPVSIVSITVKGGQTFHLHKDILTKDSAYFQRALDGPFIEGQTQSIDLDDIEPKHFGLYASLVYPTSVVTGTVRLSDVWTLRTMTKWFWTDLLRLWQLADRFLNSKIKEIAKSALFERFEGLSARRWLSRYNNKSWSYIKNFVSELNWAFRLCKEECLPFERNFVTGLSNCVPQVFAECLELLDDDFKTKATVTFALRHSDPAVTAKKRARDKERKAAKKQKQTE
ncbi:hypothetical protein VMCG_02857 [Cytospora schulzeri]|uniref:BTB domain-containing protein n=1 Tax=Cytospora schulzeri TaxID=448051 RepID=A0A423WZX4_9PEZI|nr:hypothetical protein VMCG_02857 [Valsa malicola]